MGKEIWETKPLASTQTLSWNAVTMATVRSSQSPSLHGWGGTSTQMSKLSPRDAPCPNQPKGQTERQELGPLPPPPVWSRFFCTVFISIYRNDLINGIIDHRFSVLFIRTLTLVDKFNGYRMALISNLLIT